LASGETGSMLKLISRFFPLGGLVDGPEGTII
jgi:hypothetical protein